MSMIAQIIGTNIKDMMNQHNVNITDLANELNVTRQTMSKYLSGESTIDSEKLLIISNFFDKPITYFLTEDHEELSFMLRAHDPKTNFSLILKNKMTELMERVDEVYKLSGEVISYIPQQYKIDVKLNRGKLPGDIERIIEKIAYEQRDILDVGEATGSELIKCFENKGIRIIFHALSDSTLFAASAYHEKKGSFIFVNDDKAISEEMKIFSILHEYGHLLFHRELYGKNQNFLNYSNYVYDVNEKVANSFAGYFLIPKDLLSKYDYILKDKISYSDLFFIKREFKVSLTSLVFALHKYGYINDISYRKAWATMTERGYKTKEPERIDTFPKNENYKYLVKKLYTNKKIGVSKVGELLDINTCQARNLTNFWVNDAEEEI